jgi:hypothetical protein
MASVPEILSKSAVSEIKLAPPTISAFLRRVMPAGLKYSVVASLAQAAPPANERPRPVTLCSVREKPAAYEANDMPATDATSVALASAEISLFFIMRPLGVFPLDGGGALAPRLAGH